MVGLATAPVPAGARLLPSPGETGVGVEAARRRQPKGASAYGCSVSTLRSAEGAAGGVAYDADAVYLHFPKRVIRAAGGRVALVTLAVRDQEAPVYAGTEINGIGGDGLVRVARCRVPETAEAVPLLREQLRRFRAGSWAGDGGAGQAGAGQAEGGARRSQARESGRCMRRVEMMFCYTDSRTGAVLRCEHDGYQTEFYDCVDYISVQVDPFDGGGGGGGPSDPCANGSLTITGQVCGDDPDPCDGPNPPPECKKCETGDAVIDDIGGEVEPLWEASDANNPDPFARKEQGGWITRDPATGRHRIVPFPDSFTRTACGIRILPGDLPPNTVGMFHTQPFATGDTDDYPRLQVRVRVEEFPERPGGISENAGGGDGPGFPLPGPAV